MMAAPSVFGTRTRLSRCWSECIIEKAQNFLSNRYVRKGKFWDPCLL